MDPMGEMGMHTPASVGQEMYQDLHIIELLLEGREGKEKKAEGKGGTGIGEGRAHSLEV